MSETSQLNKDIVLAINDLTKHYEEVKAVDGLSFQIKKGEIYGLLGPNGAGKTTTIKSILGLLSINKGTISLLGENPIENPQKVKEKIGYVGEEPLLFDSMTPRELFNFIASIRDLNPNEARERTLQLLESLDARKYYDSIIATLSRGNKQKMQIIAGLLHDPELLILDEPLSGLDAKSRRIVRNILSFHIETGRSILLSTHAMESAQGLCNRIGIINKGQLIAEGTLEELRELSKTADTTLEEVFLKLTDQDESVAKTTQSLRGAYLEDKQTSESSSSQNTTDQPTPPAENNAVNVNVSDNTGKDEENTQDGEISE